MVAALALGAKRRGVLALLLTYLATIAVIGTAVTLTIRFGAAALHLERYRPPAHILTIGEIGLGAALVVAAVVLAVRRRTPGPKREPRRVPVTPLGLGIAGATVAASLLIDPGFLVLVAVCAPHHPWTYPLAFAYWGAWSQILMVAVCVVVLLDRAGRVTAAMQRVVAAVVRRLPKVTVIVLAVIGLLLMLDGGHRWVALAAT